MIKKGRKLIFAGIVLFLFIAASTAVFNKNSVRAGTTGGITATIRITVCGNGVAEPPDEECDFDGPALGGETCQTQGYGGGDLGCLGTCEFDTSACTSATPTPTPTPSPTPTATTPSGGGGGGGGGGSYVAPVTNVVFSGRAYPKSAITLLKDAQIAATTIAGADANFQISISGLSAGNYIFSLYGEDNRGIRSSLLTFPVSITAGATTKVSGIFIAPTIAVDKSEVKRGDNIAIFGQSAPSADMVISVNSEEEFFGKTISDKDGVYLYNFDTSIIDYGTHNTKSKASIGNQLISSWSHLVSFKVGTKNIMAGLPRAAAKGDLNNDKRVNLVDFSIAAYWYKRSLSTAFKPIEIERLNGDGKVDLIDFSITAFYWTG